MRLRNYGIDCMARVNAARDIFVAPPGIWTRSWTEERLAPKIACTPLQPSLPIVAISLILPSAYLPPPSRHRYRGRKHCRASYLRPLGSARVGSKFVQAPA